MPITRRLGCVCSATPGTPVTYNSSGTHTCEVGADEFLIEAWGAGGGSGGAYGWLYAGTGGGGAGGYAKARVDRPAAGTINVIVGTGGTNGDPAIPTHETANGTAGGISYGQAAEFTVAGYGGNGSLYLNPNGAAGGGTLISGTGVIEQLERRSGGNGANGTGTNGVNCPTCHGGNGGAAYIGGVGGAGGRIAYIAQPGQAPGGGLGGCYGYTGRTYTPYYAGKGRVIITPLYY